ncbi:MAG: tetratricopeptide repeat protein [Bacteroidetes bacterium]|nr:tetratricopeptide repeat protein [Bacteroidota bacterium]
MLKLIFKGRLDFGTQRTYDMVLRHWHTRIESYFKNDVFFKTETVFCEAEFAFILPQQTLMSTEKNWRSTTSLLKEIAQFAVAGNIGAWWVLNGQILDEQIIEPRSEKAAVAEFMLGRQLIEAGRRIEASAALSRAIEKYEKHAQAYERRGYVNYKLQNYNDALYDFCKSIDLYPNNAEPYYGRGKVKMLKSDWEGAELDFDCTVKRSFAIQPIHWLARLRRGECLLQAKRYDEAAKELRFFLQRNFKNDDPNHRFIDKAREMLLSCEKNLPCSPTSTKDVAAKTKSAH